MRENTELRQAMVQVAGSAAFAGALMLLVGFWLGLKGVSPSEIYNHSVTVFNWTMRVGGIVMLVIAALAYAGWRPVLAVDVIFAGAVGVVMIGVGLIWVVNGDSLHGILVLLFGGLFVRSGLNSWSLLQARPTQRSESEPARSLEDASPSDRLAGGENLAASLRSARKRMDERVTMPKPDEPEPEGFLADLGRSCEDDKSK